MSTASVFFPSFQSALCFPRPRSPSCLKMKVYVENPAWRDDPFIFDQDPTLPLKHFKASARRRMEGSLQPLILFHNGNDVLGQDDDSTLDQCGIYDGTRLLMGYRVPFVIRFRCCAFVYMIEVDCLETIKSLKQKIERRTSILVEEQELEYNGSALSESGRTLLSYGIYKPTRDDFICDLTIHLAHTTKQYFDDIAAEISKEGFSNMQLTDVSVSAAKLQVHVKTGYLSEPLTLNLDSTLHISTLKQALQDKYGSRSDQLLLFSNGKNLFEENSTLEQCGIKNGDILLLGYTGCFLVKFWGCTGYILAKIDCSYTVGRLRQAIAKATGIPAYDQALSWIGGNMSDPARTLFSHGIFRTKISTYMFVITIDRQGYFEVDQPKGMFHHSFWDFHAEAARIGVPVQQLIRERNPPLCIIIPLKDDPSAVHILFDIPTLKEEFSYRFVPNETLEKVKSVIRQRKCKKFKARKEDVSFLRNGEFELEFQSQILNNNSKTLDSLGIKSGSTIQLYDSKSFEATIIDLDNKVHCIMDVHCWLTIHALKEMVHNETQVSPDEQVVYYEDQCLDRDELRLVDYHLLNLTELTKGEGVTVCSTRMQGV